MSGEEQFFTIVLTFLRMLYAVFCGAVLCSGGSSMLKFFVIASVSVVVIWQVIVVWYYVDRIGKDQ